MFCLHFFINSLCSEVIEMLYVRSQNFYVEFADSVKRKINDASVSSFLIQRAFRLKTVLYPKV